MSPWWRAAAVALIGAELTVNLTGYPLLDPDEGRNAEVMREMAATNDYLVPQLDGLPYVDKPIVYFAAGAVLMEVLGPVPLAARLPSLLFTVATLVLLSWFARRRWGEEAAWVAVLATAATPFTLAYARTVIFDAALTFWVLTALVGFFEAIESEHDGPRLLAWAAVALGTLTKGPVAIAVPLLVAVPYALWRRRTRRLLDWTAVFLFLAIVLPWVFAMSRRVPAYLTYVLGTETFGRLTTTALGREGPWWYFLPIVVAAAFPWTIAAAAWMVRRFGERVPGRAKEPIFVFLALWVAIPLLFFSLSQSKRPQYVLPLVPAVGLVMGLMWSRGLENGARRSAGAALALGGLALVLLSSRIGGWVHATPDVAAAIPGTALALGGVAAAAGFAATVVSHRGAAALLLALPAAAIPFTSVTLMEAIGRHRSAAPLAAAIESSLPPDAQVVAIETLPLSLPFYLQRDVTLVTRDAQELTSNYLLRHHDEWRRAAGSPLRPLTWWRDAVVRCSRPRVFVVASDNEAVRRALEGRLPLIADTGRHAAYGPCGPSPVATRRP